MASQPTNSSLADRYAQMSRISEMLDSLIGLDTPTPSATFTTGPNRGLPVSAMPPSVTPFRQKSAPRRVSKVTAETARARAGRTARPAVDQPVGPPKPKQAAPTKPVAKQPRPGPRPAPYTTRGGLGSPQVGPSLSQEGLEKLKDEADRANYRAGKFKWGMTPEELETYRRTQAQKERADWENKNIAPIQMSLNTLAYENSPEKYNERMSAIRERALSNIAKIGNERESQFAQLQKDIGVAPRTPEQRAADEAAFRERTRELLSPEHAQRLEDSIAADRKQGQKDLQARLWKNDFDSAIAQDSNKRMFDEMRRPFYVSDEERARAIKKLGLKRDYAGRMTNKYERGEAEYPSGIYLDPGFPSLSEAFGRFMNLPAMEGIRNFGRTVSEGTSNPNSTYYFPGKFY